jgi:hypothetical protein
MLNLGEGNRRVFGEGLIDFGKVPVTFDTHAVERAVPTQRAWRDVLLGGTLLLAVNARSVVLTGHGRSSTRFSLSLENLLSQSSDRKN